jgi:2-succinyl-5-enolpyruvyl-6-hydroxy-3-cyclohexene-1-carboxylate synthase
MRFGEMPTCKPLRQWLGSMADTPQLVIDPLGGWNEPTRIAGAIVRARPESLCAALLDRLSTPLADDSWRQAWLSAGRAAEKAIEAGLQGLSEITEPGLHRALGAAYAEGDLVYTASSMPIRDQEAFLAGSDAGVVFLANRGANGIDGLISSGIGAAHASGRPTVIVTGDLGLLHDLGALAALGEVEAPVRILVINNDGGGIFEFLPQAGELERDEFEFLLGTPRAVDCERAADLFGIEYRPVSHLNQLGDTLAAGTGLIEVRTNRAANVALHRSMTDAAVQAVERELG